MVISEAAAAGGPGCGKYIQGAFRRLWCCTAHEKQPIACTRRRNFARAGSFGKSAHPFSQHRWMNLEAQCLPTRALSAGRMYKGTGSPHFSLLHQPISLAMLFSVLPVASLLALASATTTTTNGYETYPSVAHTASINGFADKIYDLLPSCAQTCVTKSTSSTVCPYWDTGCLCVISAWISDVADCFASACSGSDVASATSLATSLCSSAGVASPYWLIDSAASSSLAAAVAEVASSSATTTAETTTSATAATTSEAAATTEATSTTEETTAAASTEPAVTSADATTAATSATTEATSAAGTTAAADSSAAADSAAASSDSAAASAASVSTYSGVAAVAAVPAAVAGVAAGFALLI